MGNESAIRTMLKRFGGVDNATGIKSMIKRLENTDEQGKRKIAPMVRNPEYVPQGNIVILDVKNVPRIESNTDDK